MSKELISKQAVLNLIDVAKNTPLEMYRGLNKHKTKLNSVMKLLEDSVNMLPDETVQNKGEWIPVSERLPETTEYVLATDGLDMFVAWYSPEKARFKGWYSYENIAVKNPILAWQPLPEPYKEGGE